MVCPPCIAITTGQSKLLVKATTSFIIVGFCLYVAMSEKVLQWRFLCTHALCANKLCNITSQSNTMQCNMHVLKGRLAGRNFPRNW